jgi:hypothetical protein
MAVPPCQRPGVIEQYRQQREGAGEHAEHVTIELSIDSVKSDASRYEALLRITCKSIRIEDPGRPVCTYVRNKCTGLRILFRNPALVHHSEDPLRDHGTRSDAS